MLNEAERQIRTLIEKAVESTDYDSIAALADLAKKIRELTSKVPPSDRVASRSKPQLRKKAARDLRSERKTSRPYPCFYREGTTLVKVGWSKSSSSEYYHRASKDEVFGAVVVLRNVASQFGRFAVYQVSCPHNRRRKKGPARLQGVSVPSMVAKRGSGGQARSQWLQLAK